MRVLLIAAAVTIGSATPAPAATVSLVTDPCEFSACKEATSLEFAAATGERNRVTVSYISGVGGGNLIVHDDGARLVAGSQCRSVDDATVACPRAETSRIRVLTGGGDDTVAIETDVETSTVRLGDGDDRAVGAFSAYGDDGQDVLDAGDPGNFGSAHLDGGAGDDVLTGGRGADSLSGGLGRDILRGAAGPDGLDVSDVVRDDAGRGLAEAPARDEADGGPGIDTLSYESREAGVVADLADQQPEGTGDEGDVATGVENVVGGDGHDRLAGDGGPNLLFGGLGRDVIDGRGGNDILMTIRDALDGGSVRPDRGDDEIRSVVQGGPGDDELVSGAGLLEGGSGDDVLRRVLPGDGIVRCGTGRDVVTVFSGAGGTQPRFRLNSDGCEVFLLRTPRTAYQRPNANLATLRPPGRLVGGVASFRLACPPGRRAPRCRAAVVLRDTRGRRIGVSRREIAPGRSRTLTVRVPRAFLRAAPVDVRADVELRTTPKLGPTKVWLALALPSGRAAG